MTPQELAKSGSEHAHQRAYFQALLTWSPQVHELTFAIPNGGSRGSDAKSRAIQGGRLKAEGVKSGIPDVMCAIPNNGYAGLFLEFKKMSGGVVADNQKDYKTLLRSRGYAVFTVYNWQESMNATCRYFGQQLPFPKAACGE